MQVQFFNILFQACNMFVESFRKKKIQLIPTFYDLCARNHIIQVEEQH